MKAAGMPRYEPWNAERASQIIARHRHQEGATLPILHALQEAFGCVPEAAVPMVAEALNLSRAEVHGTVADRRASGRGGIAQPRRIAERSSATSPDRLV